MTRWHVFCYFVDENMLWKIRLASIVPTAFPFVSGLFKLGNPILKVLLLDSCTPWAVVGSRSNHSSLNSMCKDFWVFKHSRFWRISSVFICNWDCGLLRDWWLGEIPAFFDHLQRPRRGLKHLNFWTHSRGLEHL